MTATIRLLGRPGIDGPGRPRVLAGHKPWALLAVLALTPAGLGRRDLAELMWPQAADPLAALRWALLQARRALDEVAVIADDRQDRLVLQLTDARVDVLRLLDGRLEPGEVRDLVRGEFLEGLAFQDAPELEDWIALQRARTSSAGGASCRWAALLLAGRDPDTALDLVRQALAFDPFDDAAHELGISIEVARGHRTAAERRFAIAVRRYQAELGIDAPETLRRAFDRPVLGTGFRATPASATRASLAAAEARLDAGDYPGAEAAARRAATEAAASGQDALEAEALSTLGGVLIHSVRGRDREAVGLLERAFALGVAAGQDRLAAEVERELGWVAFLEAQYGAAESILRRSIERSHAVGDDAGANRALMIIGASQCDRGDREAGEATLVEAAGRLHDLGDRWEPFAEAFLARVRMQTGRAEDAMQRAHHATSRSREVGWLSLLPWPLAVAGEAEVRVGRTAAASETFDEAWALACEIGDPCWRSFALRGRALVAREHGDLVEATELLRQAAGEAASLPDVYTWCEALVLTDLAEIEQGSDRGVVQAALELARRGPMPDLVARLAAIAPGQTRAQTARP